MALADLWGQGQLRQIFFPTISEDVLSNDVYRAIEKISASNRNFRHLCEMLVDIDVRNILPTIRVPTLVVHFTGDLAVPSRMGRFLADHIPNAEFLEVAGADHGDISNAPEAIERIRSFCSEVMASEQSQPTTTTEEILATVIHVSSSNPIPQDVVPAAAREFHATIAEQEAETSATLAFDGPTRAVRCALSILSKLDFEVTVSAHSGLVVRGNGPLAGPAVQRVVELNRVIKPGAVYATGTLRDLLLRSGLDIRPVEVVPPGFNRLATVASAI